MKLSQLAKYLPFVAAFFLHCHSPVSSLTCPPTCDPAYCSPEPLDCQYGQTVDICACCMECMKGPGESCGGIWGEFGKCTNGTECLVTAPRETSCTSFLHKPGICVPIEMEAASSCIPQPSPTSSTFDESTLSPSPSFFTTTTPTPTPQLKKKYRCRPNCTIDFCFDGRNKFCSAIMSGVDLVDERYPCQHTTCRACHLIVTPSCPKCPEPVKKRCLRHYYLCIEEHFKRNDTILALHDPKAQTAIGEIRCYIPELLETITETGSGGSSSG